MVVTSHPKNAPKPSMLVVDDEPDNLDLLYRTFRREFDVLRAESGHQALDILAKHGEVAVIISDQRMPEMKGTEFLSKTVPVFPDTVRIILTGFTDVEDLVDAINDGQVYRYITKPWDPEELKDVVEQAAKTYEVLKHRGEAIRLSQSQQMLIMKMTEIAQTTHEVDIALPAIAQMIQKVLPCDGCVVQLIDEGELGLPMGAAGIADAAYLKENVMVTDAIASRAMQLSKDMACESNAMGSSADQAATVRAHCVAPVIFRSEVMAIISFQWKHPREFAQTIQDLMHLAVKQAGVTLACL